MLIRFVLCLVILCVYISVGDARPEVYPSQDTQRVRRSVIYDQNNDWDSIMLKGKDLIHQIKQVVHKRWKGVVDHSENAKQVDNVIFSLRCKLNEVKEKIYNFGPIKYVRDLYEEFNYYQKYFQEQSKNQNWAG
ncbi:hypothetical protein M8J76_003616 [Diaphorina citri]|nr:hypothetical protein M8J75_010881 [Diaphorina citri]KAI5748958.1 hypothetical protein M8J76_003616 [Diaphorina citri]